MYCDGFLNTIFVSQEYQISLQDCRSLKNKQNPTKIQ